MAYYYTRERARCTLRLPQELHDRLVKYTEKQNEKRNWNLLSQNLVIEKALDEYLTKKEAEAAKKPSNPKPLKER